MQIYLRFSEVQPIFKLRSRLKLVQNDQIFIWVFPKCYLISGYEVDEGSVNRMLQAAKHAEYILTRMTINSPVNVHKCLIPATQRKYL